MKNSNISLWRGMTEDEEMNKRLKKTCLRNFAVREKKEMCR